MRRGIGYNITAWFFVLIVFMVGASQAAETWISKTANIKDPRKIALAPDGGLMVTAPVWNSIVSLDRSGDVLGSVSSQHPSALAVSPDGLIYVAVGKYSSKLPPYTTKGEVRVYDNNFAYLYSLGAGAGEFVNPVDIEIAADGTVYVADLGKNEIKVFNSDGSKKLSIGKYGIGDGFFNKPLSVAIDNLTGDIYVADCQVRQDQVGGGYGDGVRIQAYDKNGAFIKGFGIFGELFSISDIAFNKGNLYVSDSYLDMIYVYNTATGLLDHSFSNPDSSIRQPSSVAISPDGILYVAGNGSNDVNMFGIDDFVLFTVAPDALNFIGFEGMAKPAAKNLTIANTGNGDLIWTLTGDAWINSSATNGVLAPGNSTVVSIEVDQSGMAAGPHAGAISVTNQNGTSSNVAVDLLVAAQPQFVLSANSLTFTADAAAPSMLSQGISVALNGALPESYWTAGATANWLSVNPVQAGTSAADVTVSVNTTGLAAGTHTGEITFESQQPSGVSATLTVSLSVASSGQITVTTNLAEATFTVKDSNGASFSGSSKSWTQNNVPDGIYTITFDRVAGFSTPKSAIGEISGGNSISFMGQYVDRRSANNIIASGISARGNATIRIFSPDGATLLNEFTPFDGIRSTVPFNLATGDIDGDGARDIIVGLGNSSGYQSRVAVYNSDGTLIPGTDFIAFRSKGGAKVAAGDFDGDGKDEIIVAAGEDVRSNAQFRIFTYNALNADSGVTDSGIGVTAFGSKLGANIAVGDIDGDGNPELIVSPGPDRNAAAEVLVFGIDTAGGMGNWLAHQVGSAIIPFEGKCGANIAAGDLDSDGKAEIVAASGNCAGNPGRIAALYGDGNPFKTNISYAATGGLGVAVGDLDMDGNAEIVVSGDRISSSGAQIDAFSAGGDSLLSFIAFDKNKKSSAGAKIALGEMGY